MMIDLIHKISDFIGIIGVLLLLIGYFLLQLGRLQQDNILYSLLNLIGSLFVLVSLFYTWNLAAGVVEIAWIFISVVGLVKTGLLKK